MKYPYPQISNVLGYRRIDADTVEVTNHLYDERFTLSLEQVRFLQELDGFTHPFRIPTPMSREEIKKLLRTAKEGGLTRRSTLWRSGWTVLKTLWEPAVGLGLCVTARIVNALLALAWLPVLIWGIVVFFGNLTELHGLGLELGLLGILPGILLHEIGHAFAGIAYGARVFEMGLLFQCWVLPVGAYVAMDDTRLGGLIGALMGVAGGPLGMVLMGGYGALVGSAIDWSDAAANASMMEHVLGCVGEDEPVLIAVVQEKDESAFDKNFEKFDADITRFDAAEVAEEVAEAQRIQEEMARQAKKQLREAKKQDRKQKIEERREKIKSHFGSIGKKA